MQAIGVSVERRPGAVEPVNVQVRRAVRILRQAPTAAPGPGEPQLVPESVAAIVQLIDQSGKGFGTAPETFAKLGEEDLRNIILGHLNAVFSLGGHR